MTGCQTKLHTWMKHMQQSPIPPQVEHECHHYLGFGSWFQLLQLLGCSLNGSCCPQQLVLSDDGGVFWVNPLSP